MRDGESALVDVRIEAIGVQRGDVVDEVERRAVVRGARR
jgi:hypothetical protein